MTYSRYQPHYTNGHTAAPGGNNGVPSQALSNHALQATQALRSSAGYGALSAHERADFDYHLGRVESALRGENPAPDARPARGSYQNQGYGTNASYDPYAVPSYPSTHNYGSANSYSGESSYPGTNSYATPTNYASQFATPNDFLGGGSRGNNPGRSNAQQPPQNPQQGGGQQNQPPRPSGTEVLGERARRALDAVDFPSFVAELIQGTFIAIVDATSQQVREYAKLVADLSQTAEKFTAANVNINQARDRLVELHPAHLKLVLPGPGEIGEPRVEPFEDLDDDSPSWLEDYGLAGSELTVELVEGPLLDASRRALGEERMRNLATMVLMGINRIVVDDGELKARLHFHAKAREKVTADIVAQGGAQQIGIAGRQNTMQSAVSTMVSTVDVNSQADISLKADLVGEVSLKFRTETFDLNNFADTDVVQMISRHSLNRDNNMQNGGTQTGGTQSTNGQIPPTNTQAPFNQQPVNQQAPINQQAGPQNTQTQPAIPPNQATPDPVTGG